MKSKPSSGESRIYICSRSSFNENKFFTFNGMTTYINNKFPASGAECYFKKNTLLEYLELSFKEYHEPAQNYFYDISEYYSELKETINNYSGERISFHIFDHRGKADSDRFYINSTDPIWSTFRKIALPLITKLSITKTPLRNSYEYEFKLMLDSKFSKNTPASVIREAGTNENYGNETTFSALVALRKGQGQYKNKLLLTMKSCPFTHISEPMLLIASHAKPWSEANDSERLDGYNGLLLSPTYDVLFDRGLISFSNEGSLNISSLLSKDIIKKLNLKQGKIYSIANETGLRSPYLSYHREFVFKP